MSPNFSKKQPTRPGNAGRIALAVALATLIVGMAAAEPSISISGPELEKLMLKVKAEHPEARILKVEREANGGGPEVYEIKLLRPDGQVLKLYFDVVTLAPVAQSDHDGGTPQRRRLRERRREHW